MNIANSDKLSDRKKHKTDLEIANERIKIAFETNASELNLSCLSINELPAAIDSLANLRYMWCFSTQIADLSPISNLTNLQYLYCDFTCVSDLSPLVGLSNLRVINCSNTLVTDFSPLSEMVQNGLIIRK